MTVAHLADHTCVIWRKTETLGEHRETVKAFTLVEAGIACKADRKNTILAQAGPGIVQTGGRRIFMDLGPTILKRDLLELVTGPDAPELLEVENVTRPRNHHIEVWCTEYDGEEPALTS